MERQLAQKEGSSTLGKRLGSSSKQSHSKTGRRKAGEAARLAVTR